MTALDQVDILSAQLKELLPMKQEDRQRLDKKFRLEFNYNSNHLEGNTLTYGETELLLIFDDTKGAHTMREYEEMKAHDVAYHLVEEWAQDRERPLTEQNIKNLNEVILVRSFWKDAITPNGQSTRRQIKVGDYKEHPNSVRLQNGEIFEYSSPTDTPIQMQELIDWYREEESSIHPVTLAAMLHYKFVRIHPFDDGNGRVSRLLMNYVLLRNGLPPVIIKSKDKTNYLRTLNLADIGDFQPFINYITEQVVWSLELYISAAKGESIQEKNDWEKKLLVLKTQTSQNEHLKILRSDEAIHNVIKNSIFPLIKRTIESLSKFDDLFAGKNMSFYKRGIGTEIHDINSLIKELQDNPNEFNHSLQFNYQLEGFKRNGKNPFYCTTSIYWEFENYMYYMNINNRNYNNRFKHFYHEIYTDEEINNYVNECANTILEDIERQQAQFKG